MRAPGAVERIGAAITDKPGSHSSKFFAKPRFATRSTSAASAARSVRVASENLAFGLGRMFQAHRELDRRSTREVGIFRTMEEALAFLGLDHALELPEPA